MRKTCLVVSFGVVLGLGGCAGPGAAGATSATSQAVPPSPLGGEGRGEGRRDAPPPTTTELLAASPAADWRGLIPEDTLLLDLPAGRVVIALATSFAPRHAANLRALARQGYFDGLAIVRAQEGFVVQWGDPAAGEAGERPITGASRTLPPEFTRSAAGLPFTRLPDGDVYAPEVGFSDGWPAARDPATGQAWLVHCYGVVGAGRDNAPDSGGGAELYAVVGHAPRQLDRNVTVVGRVVQGMEHLSTAPRGPAPMGFYAEAGQRTPIRALRVAADLPPAERPALELLRTDSPTFEVLVEARRNRRDAWYLTPAGRIDLCSVPLPVRPAGR